MSTDSTHVSPLKRGLASIRMSFWHVGLFSALINLLMLTGSFYMLQIYDRVIPSRSIATLVGLSVLAVAAYAFQGVLDFVRAKLLARLSAQFDSDVAPRVAEALVVLPLKGAKPHEVVQPLRDLDAIRGFLGSLGPTAFLDMPFMPIFLVGCYILHPWLCVLAVFGVILILALTLFTEKRSKEPSLSVTRSATERQILSEAGRRNAEAIAALGMRGTFAARFHAAHDRQVRDTLALTDISGSIGAFAKVVRMVLQSAVLGLGAYLVIKGEVSAGAMIAASILTSRVLAPIELAVANWKGFLAARQGYERLGKILGYTSNPARDVSLPPPSASLELQGLFVTAPGKPRPIVNGVSFGLKAGQGLGLIGPSGSGKSTLARALVGVWPAARGHMRLDGAPMEQWDADTLGRSVGYLPQDVELFDGSVAQNIARLDLDPDSNAVLAAARAAGAHEMILALPDGYDTRIGESGTALSGGQRQRLGLARALYGDPFLIVLDEPNSSLDAEGDKALNTAILTARKRGAIVIVITHRPAGLAAVDMVGAMSDGKMQAFGPREDVMKTLMKQGGVTSVARPQATAPAPLADVAVRSERSV